MSQIIKKALLCHAAGNGATCAECPYNCIAPCGRNLTTDSLAYIETLEEQLYEAQIRIDASVALANTQQKLRREAEAKAAELEKQLALYVNASREDRILDGLERCQDGSPDSCRGCGYRDIDDDCGTDLMRDAAQLLRELMGKEA